MKKLSWKPVELGSKYCAPACGRGCTKTEYDHAVANAEMLARTLGTDWTTDVWENLGWHCAVRSPCDRLSVHLGSGASFIAFLSVPGSIGGRWSAHEDTPQKAIDSALKKAKTEYDQIGSILKNL